MQLRLTGIDAEGVPMDPSDAGPRDDPAEPPVAVDLNVFNKPDAEAGGVTKFRFRLNRVWSRGVWSRLCDPTKRM